MASTTFLRKVAFICLLATIGCVSNGRELSATPQNVGKQVASLQAGDVLYLSSGVFRTTLDFGAKKGTAEHPIVVRGAGQNKTIITGADVLTGWRQVKADLYAASLSSESSSLWVNDKLYTQWGGTVFGGFPLTSVPALDTLHKSSGGIWPGRRSISNVAELPINGFWWNPVQRIMYVRSKTDLRSAKVEVATRLRTLFVQNGAYIKVSGATFERANTSISTRGGSVVLIGKYLRLSDSLVQENDLGGVQIVGDFNEVADVTARGNGQAGVFARGNSNNFLRVLAKENNYRGFNKWWEAGGFKFVGAGGLSNSTLIDCAAIRNYGDGIWFDWKNDSNRVVRSLSLYNTGFGFHYEASTGLTLVDSISAYNGQRGVYLADSSNSRVERNLILGNVLQGVAAVSTGRLDDFGVPFPSTGNVFVSNIIAWNGEGALIVPKSSGNIAQRNAYLGQGSEISFSIEFPSSVNRRYSGLAFWLSATGQDVGSVMVGGASFSMASFPKNIDGFVDVIDFVSRVRYQSGLSVGPDVSRGE